MGERKNSLKATLADSTNPHMLLKQSSSVAFCTEEDMKLVVLWIHVEMNSKVGSSWTVREAPHTAPTPSAGSAAPIGREPRPMGPVGMRIVCRATLSTHAPRRLQGPGSRFLGAACNNAVK
ncbi:hypothetical protein UY3_07316 [Chelonia mydas]|uniref:Uncharacterized protein n=1 Tax=Chelonia mydas TaxID=8469 RepID=M7BC39_CHEMY|nr:hypothetical protein UY3_07316 [Chelonia mydas]